MWHKFANPTRLQSVIDRSKMWLLAASLIAIAVGLVGALFIAPADYLQGDAARIMYVHVPCAWLGMFCYLALAMSSIMGLIWKHPVAYFTARAIAPIGAGFTMIALVTGAIWGIPTWGTYWVWDARLTSMLVLFFLYIAYIALVKSFEDVEKGDKVSCILAIVGVVNLPIIKFSVDWWNTLHQPASITRVGAPAIHSTMLWPLIVMALGLFLLALWMGMVRLQLEILKRKLHIKMIEKVFSDG